MKLISFVLCLPAFAQPAGRIMSGSAKVGTVGFSFETRLEPASPRLEGLDGGGVVAGNPAAHRFTEDRIHHVYFGYDIAIDPLPQTNTYQVTIRPLSLPRERLFTEKFWTMLPLPGYPAPQTVTEGETIELDLMENRSTGQKIVDYIRIQSRVHLSGGVQGPTRDFSVGDVELQIAQPKVILNGNEIETEGKVQHTFTAPIVFFYLPNRGRYVLSIEPHPSLGFVRAGEIRADSLTFTLGGDTITLDCNGPIVPGYTPYNLYVFHDQPPRTSRDGQSSFQMSVAATAEALLRR